MLSVYNYIFVVNGFDCMLALSGIVLQGFNQVYVYSFWYNFVSLKKDRILSDRIYK